MLRSCSRMAPLSAGVCLLAGLAFSAVAQGEQSFLTRPVLVWGSADYFTAQPASSTVRASYESLPASYIVEDVFKPLALGDFDKAAEAGFGGDKLAADASRLVTVLVLGNLQRRDLLRPSASSTVRDAFQAASSALFFANVAAENDSSLKDAVSRSNMELVRLGGCGVEDASTNQLQSALEATSGPVSVLLCEEAGSDLFSAVKLQLETSQRPHVFVYAGRPDEVAARPTARALISTSAPAPTGMLCTGKCRVQVRLFECIYLLIVLLTALGVGMCMMHILDTPSRFETGKKEANRHQD